MKLHVRRKEFRMHKIKQIQFYTSLLSSLIVLKTFLLSVSLSFFFFFLSSTLGFWFHMINPKLADALMRNKHKHFLTRRPYGTVSKSKCLIKIEAVNASLLLISAIS